MEFFRADNRPIYGGFTLSQIISVILVLLSLGLLFSLRSRKEITSGVWLPKKMAT